MYTIDEYIIDTMKLTSSLVVKVTEVVNAINDGILATQGVAIPLDKHEWKHYLNVSGEKHFTNNAVMVYVKHENSILELTKPLLVAQPGLRDELLTMKSLYLTLLQDYPDDIEYIKGVLYPVDIDAAINAPNGTVLAYNRTLVLYNEMSLVRELEDRIKGFLSRWHVVEYISTDELYLTSMLGVLYSAIPTMIMNIRSSKVKTNEVSLFHMEHFFRSHLDVWEPITLVDITTKIWLYNNLEYLMDNVGQNIVISKIIDKILTPNGIGVGEYVLSKDDINLDATVVNDSTLPLYQLPKPNLQRKPLNYLYDTTSTVPSIATVMKNEIIGDLRKESNIGDLIANYSIDGIIENMGLKVNGKQDTKLIELNGLALTTFHGVDIVKVLVDEFINIAMVNPYDYDVDFIDPNTGNIYTLNLKNSVYMLLALMHGANAVTVPLTDYVHNNILDNTVVASDLLPLLMYDTNNDFIVNELVKSLPNKGAIASNTTLANYLSDVINYYVTNNKLMSNINDNKLHANIEAMNNKILLRGRIDITVNNLPVLPRDVLFNSGIDLVTTTGYDYGLSLNELLKVITGINTDQFGDMNNFIDSYTMLINKLTSYDLQVIKNVDYNKGTSVKHSTPMISSGLDGVVKVLSANEEYVISPILTDQVVVANNFVDVVKTTGYFNNTTTSIF